MTPDQPRLFFLGATGYIGSQFLASAKRDASLYAKLKEFALVALVRDPDNAKAKQLQEVWPDVVLVKGTLDDLEIVEDQARNAALTFNAADCDHVSSVQGGDSNRASPQSELSSDYFTFFFSQPSLPAYRNDLQSILVTPNLFISTPQVSAS